MQPKRFDQARPFLTLGILIAGWLVVPVAVKSLLRASFFEFQAPLAVAASHVRDLQDYWALRLHSNDELIQAGRDLGRLIQRSTAVGARPRPPAPRAADRDPVRRTGAMAPPCE